MSRRVLVAEDEAIIRMDLREMLEEEGFDVVGEAADGRKAVELAREHRPDLVILDIKMPGMNGIRAAEIITRERISAVVIALERYGDFTRLEGQVDSLEDRLETRKVVERAKGILQQQGLSEDDAYKLMQRAAMDRSLPMAQVARLVIDGKLGGA
jgi:response regulator NasT